MQLGLVGGGVTEQDEVSQQGKQHQAHEAANHDAGADVGVGASRAGAVGAGLDDGGDGVAGGAQQRGGAVDNRIGLHTSGKSTATDSSNCKVLDVRGQHTGHGLGSVQLSGSIELVCTWNQGTV